MKKFDFCFKGLSLAMILWVSPPLTAIAEPRGFIASVVQQSNIQVKGLVVDEQGESIIGATVMLRGTKHGTITDLDGKFVLDVPLGSQLVVSYIGFTNSTVTAEKDMTITLHSNVAALDEVVVVGYGIQKKVDVVGSISTVNSKQLEARGVSNVSNLLTGHLSGVTITQESGNPGDDGASIRVRGVGSFGAKPEPLVLIDGLPGSWSDLTPADIETISVLKDASSAAIYGSRAANGVILVTTKGGKDGRTRVTYNGLVGLSKARSLPEFAHSYEYATFYNMAVGKNTYTADMIQKYKDGSDPDHYADENYLEKLLGGTALQTKHELGVSGGNGRLQYMAALSYMRQNGLVPHNYYNHYQGRVNLSADLTRRLKLNVRLNGIVSDRHEPSTPGALDLSRVKAIIQQAVRYPGLTPTYMSDGSLGLGPKLQGTPLSWAESASFYRVDENRFKANADLAYMPFKGLVLKMIGGYHYLSSNAYDYRCNMILGNGKGTGPSSLNQRMERMVYKTFQFVGNYNVLLGKHELSALVGYAWEDEGLRDLSGYRNKFPSDLTPYLDAGGADGQLNSGGGYDWAMQSFFGRMTYNYDQRYLFEATARYDGSSRFPTGNKYAFFPSVAVGWRVSEESFWKSLKPLQFFSNLKVKASHGVLGNNNIGNYPYQSIYTLGDKQNYVFGGVYTQGAAVTTYVDPTLKWERTKTTDVGLETAFFNNALTFNTTYFYRKTSDILYKPAASYSAIFGLAVSQVNTGELENRGWEFELGYQNHTGRLNYHVNSNLSIIKNKVLTLGMGNVLQNNGMVGNGSDLFIGYPMEMFYGYKTDGVFLKDSEVATWYDQTAIAKGSRAGDVRYVDVTGDGKVTSADKIYLGSRIPKYTFGLNVGLAYNGFDFSLLLQGVAGVKGLLSRYAGLAFNQEGNIQRWQMEENWNVQPNNRYPGYPRLEVTSNSGSRNTLLSDYWVLNASFVKVRNIQLGYTIPAKHTKRWGISNAHVYLSLDNPISFDHYRKGWDPENTNTDGNYYPVLSTYTLGLTLSL